MEEVGMSRRLIAAIALCGFFGAAELSAAAVQPKVERTRATFEITSKTCPLLPKKTRIRGAGPMRSVTTTTTGSNGITTVVNVTHARGRATDQDGNRYVFEYSNSFSVSNTAQAPTVYGGL